ncbi:hypothetical protein D4740_12580 [Actinomyces sp. 2119]|nr:hypothetical protein D4740_12580 [Actinomyces sp. 2119]
MSGGEVVPATGAGTWRATWLLRHRAVRAAVATVLLVGVGACGFLWWTRPPSAHVDLPAGVEEGQRTFLSGPVEPTRTEAGILRLAELRGRAHRWEATLEWQRRGGTQDYLELGLGDSVHVDGLGTITLVGASPGPLMPWNRAPGSGDQVVLNINLDPGVTLLP